MTFDYTLKITDVLKNMGGKGGFLTVKDKNGRVNTMTIGWCNIGYEWARPIFTVLVRQSRYTHELLENVEDFTVSIPLDINMNKALGFCGSKSGRDFDKFKECNLNLLESKSVKSPVIDNCQKVGGYPVPLCYQSSFSPPLPISTTSSLVFSIRLSFIS